MPGPRLSILWVHYPNGTAGQFKEALEACHHFQVTTVENNRLAEEFLVERGDSIDAIVIDAQGDEKEPQSLIRRLGKLCPDTEAILLMEREGEPRRQAIRNGAFQMFETPTWPDEFVRTMRLAALQTRQRRILQEILSRSDLYRVLDDILGLTIALVQADEAYIMVQGTDPERLTLYPEPSQKETRCTRILKDRNLSQEILDSGEPMSIADTRVDARVTKSLIATDVRSFAAVPAIFNGKKAGVLYAFSYTPRHFEQEGLLALLDDPARLTGQAIISLSEMAMTLIHGNYMANLVETSQMFTQAQTDEEQFDIAWKYVSTKLNVSTFYIGIYDPAQDILRYPLFYDNGIRMEAPERFLGDQRSNWGISGFVLKTGEEQSWRTHKESQEICKANQIQTIQLGDSCESCFYLPLKKGDQVLGMISFQSHTRDAFNKTIKNAFRSLGNLLVVGMEKNRLYQEEKKRRSEAEALHAASLRISSEQGIQNITRTALEELKKIVPYDSATVQLFEEEQFKIIDCQGLPNPEQFIGISFPADGDNPNKRVYATGQPVRLADAPQEYPDFSRPPHASAGIRGWMGVPMSVGGEFIGILDAGKHEAGFYTPVHEQLAWPLATTTALALRNAQSFERMKRTREYIQTLYEAGVEILSTQESGQMLEKIVNNVCQASHAMRAHVLLMEENCDVKLLVQSGFDQETDLTTKVRQDGVSWKVFRTGKPFFKSPILEQDPEVHPDLYRQGVRAVACLPLLIGEKPIGVLWIHYSAPHQFNGVERNILRLFAIQSAVTYDRIRLYEEMKKAQDEVHLIAEKSTEGYFEATLKAIVTGVKKTMHCDSVTLYPYNQDKNEFLFPPTLLDVQDPDSVMTLARVSERSVIWRILELDQYHKTEDAQNDQLLTGDYDRKDNTEPFVKREGIVASLSFPLRIGSRKVGVMFVNFRRKHTFTQQELINAGVFANQAAIVIHNVQLHQDTTQKAELLKALDDAGLIVDQDLGLDDILSQIAKKAWDLAGKYAPPANLCNVSLIEDGKLIVHAVYPVGKPSLLKEIELYSPKIGISGRAAISGQTQLVEDVSQDLDYLVFDKNTVSELAVPIKVDGKARGVINLEASTLSAFDREDVISLEVLAQQAGVAIKNAESIRPAVLDPMVLQIGALPPEQLLKMIVNTIRTYSGAWRAVALLIDEEKGDYKVAVQEGFEPKSDAELPIRPNGNSLKVMRTHQAYYCDNCHKDAAHVHPQTIRQGARALACLPLNVEGKTIGVLWIHFRESHTFTAEEKHALEFYASQSASALDRVLKQEEWEQTKQELNASTTLLYMNMISSVWRHAIENNANIINDAVDFIYKRIRQGKLDDTFLKEKLQEIKKQTEQIREKPISSPLSAEEGVVTTDINGLVKERVEQLWTNPKYSVAELDPHIDMSRPVFTRVCPEWLKRALEILLDNAVKATENRLDKTQSRKVSVTTCELDATLHSGIRSLMARHWAQILVSDNGPGISEIAMAHLLKKPVPKQKTEKGLGLGMLMARSIVQVYGGEILIKNTSSQGTDIAILLPLASGPEK